MVAAPAAAQTAAAPPPAGVTVRWDNGLSLESSTGDYVFQVGTLLQVDGRFATGDPPPITNTFLIRRGRILLQGRVARHTEFYLVPEFAGSTLTLLDAYADTRIAPAFRVRLGKSKSPIGLEQLYSDANVPFAERSLATNLAPNRDVGVSALGDLWSGRVSYVAGVLNGVADTANGDVDTNSGKDVAGRVTAMIGPIGLAVAGSRGNAVGSVPDFRTTAQQPFFYYASGVTADGARRRVTPSVFIYRRSFGAFAEYFRNTQRVANGGVSANLTHTAWNATVIVVLTGEAASDRGVTPRSPLNPTDGRWGALQLAVRASAVTIDSQTFALGLAAPGASRTARATGVGLVWYHTTQVKHVFTVERTVFDTIGGVRRPEHAIVYRLQINLAPRLQP